MIDQPPRRKTLAEMASQSNGVDSVYCPKCGAHEWRGQQNARVESTRHPDGKIVTVRRRICQCGQHAFRTEEVIVPDGCKVVVIPENEGG